MNGGEIMRRLASIQASKRDSEVAHAKEDELLRDVLAAIALGMCDDPAECARLALKSREIKFARWCA